MTESEFAYGSLILLAVIVLALTAAVAWRAKFCHPITLVAVALVGLYNVFLLTAGSQRLAQRADVTVGQWGLLLTQVGTVAAWLWIVHDANGKRWRR